MGNRVYEGVLELIRYLGFLGLIGLTCMTRCRSADTAKDTGVALFDKVENV